MTALSEARLIEIEHRFALLETAIRQLDKIAANVERRHRKSMEAASGREARDHEMEMDRVMEVRALAEMQAELCRDDLMLMQETVRGRR